MAHTSKQKVAGRRTAAQAEREEAAPAKLNSFEGTNKGQAWPSHSQAESKGRRDGEQTSACVTPPSEVRHIIQQKDARRKTAAQAERERANASQ